MSGPGALLFGNEERKELMDVIKSGYLFRYGSEDDPNFKHKVYSFEHEFASYMGVDYCVAVNSGTSALLTGMTALGIGPGDEVIVPGYTFIASISSIIFTRAVPVLAEIDESLTIDPEDIKRKITKNTKAIMPVHMMGNPCKMDEIMKIAKENNFYVIEDCCQAAGGSYKGKKLGSIGDVGCFSLNRFKTINSGDGGVVITKDKKLYERAFAFHDQGHFPNRMGSEYGNRTTMGLDFRMTELQGAVALAQVRKLDKIISMLKKKKLKIKNAISKINGVLFRKINDEEGECFTLLTLTFKDKATASRFAEEIGAKTLDYSGWHVYNNMEHLLGKKMPTEFNCPFACKEYGKEIEYKMHMLPKTDDILARSVNISIGVSDVNLGSKIGINILSPDKEVKAITDKIIDALKKSI